jgi:hypothetical protein
VLSYCMRPLPSKLRGGTCLAERNSARPDKSFLRFQRCDDTHSPGVVMSRDEDIMVGICRTYILDLNTTTDYDRVTAPPSHS